MSNNTGVAKFCILRLKRCKLPLAALPVHPRRILKTAGQTKEMFMHIALGIAFAMVAVAPFFGRWRANVWLKKNMPARRVVKTHDVPEAA